MSNEKSDAIDWPREVTAVLDNLGDQAVRVREGGGPENLAASLAVTVAKLSRPPQFTAIRGARPGDVVFLTPARDLSADEAKHLCNALHEFSLRSLIHTVILPMGFSVNGKPTEDDVCVYTPEDEGPGGSPTRYDTACHKIWHSSSCLSELHPFCAYCGKPISVAPFSTDLKPKGE